MLLSCLVIDEMRNLGYRLISSSQSYVDVGKGQKLQLMVWFEIDPNAKIQHD